LRDVEGADYPAQRDRGIGGPPRRIDAAAPSRGGVEFKGHLTEILRRPSLRSQLNQIRLWVRQGRTDPWIAHKLDISVEQLRTFKRDQGLSGDPAPSAPPADEGDAEIPDEADVEPIEEIPAEELAAEARESEPELSEPETEEAPPRRRRRGRRGGRRRGAKASADSYEATFEHGGEGYGLWLDPAVAESEVYSENWAGHRAVSVTVEPDAITIRRIEEDDEED
jgi:hypothetical protein